MVDITMFGKTKMYPIKGNVYINAYKTEDVEWDEILWVERGEDWYAFSNEKYRDKKVLVVNRDIWIACETKELKQKRDE